MFKESIKTADVCDATVARGASHTESTSIEGYYFIQCHDAEGALKWEDEISNLVTTVGKNLTITGALTNAAQGVSYMGLKGTGTPDVTDTQASHVTWLEVGGANAPTYTGNRKTPTWGAATAGAISPTGAQVFAMTGSGTVSGCFINVGGLATKDDTTGTLFSVGDFTAGDKLVASGDTLSVSYTATAA